MAVIAVENAKDGIAGVTFTAATGGGDTIVPGSAAGGWRTGTVLVVKNGHTATQTVTVAGHPAIAAAANGGIAIIPVHGLGKQAKAVTYSGVTALTVGAVNLNGLD
jgi:hypothetical protein